MTGVLHAVAAFLLTLVGYSGGAVLAAAVRRPRPAVWELPLAAATAVGGAVLAPGLVGTWTALPAAAAAGLAVGGAAGGLARLASGRRRTRSPGRPAADAGAGGSGPGGRGEGPADAAEPDVPAHRRFLLRLGDYQGQITMGLLYFGLLAPFAALSRLGEDPLRLREVRASYWRKRPDGRDRDPEQSLRRQF